MRSAISGLQAGDGPSDGVTCLVAIYSSRGKVCLGRYEAIISAGDDGRSAIASPTVCTTCGRPSRHYLADGAASAAFVCRSGGASRRRDIRLGGPADCILDGGCSLGITINGAAGITITVGRLTFASFIGTGLSQKACRGISDLITAVLTPISSVFVAKVRPSACGRLFPTLLKRSYGCRPTGGRAGRRMSVSSAGRPRVSGCPTSSATNVRNYFGLVFMADRALPSGQSGISSAAICIASAPKTTKVTVLRPV